MSKKRVYEIAKILNVGNKELIGKLKDMGVEVKSHSSSIDDETADRLIKLYTGSSDKSADKKPEVRAEKTEKPVKPEKAEKAEKPKRRALCGGTV